MINTFFLIVSCFWALGRAADWSYPSFPKWGGLCDEGKQQSPIDLNDQESKKVNLDRLILHNYEKTQENLTMVNNGHTIQVSGFKSNLTLSGGILKNEYVLEQIHMHWESEHTINGIRYPLEMHFVHRNPIYPNIKTATMFEDGVAVIGVLFHESHVENELLGAVTRILKAVKGYDMIDQPVKMEEPLVLDYLVPSLKSYYSYAGSLTTPGCSEAVTWIVLTETLPVSLQQLTKFKEIEYRPGMQLRSNYRELQTKGDRKVFLVSEAPELARLSVPLSLILTFTIANQKFFL
ncbi:uncharacterized protein LOC110188452 [Drosophila serrata]|uniref:uncharacterized protein LOC110188452 n=1 Tax=Drosophila serrata TaxID=7274 RepID=UPI000A1CF9E5|nr:uncharacterized protein LOC110188452 [Drosophila serrata]KAH8362328.1 hypothetical protein KR200_011012 [Drosophila serrata]